MKVIGAGIAISCTIAKSAGFRKRTYETIKCIMKNTSTTLGHVKGRTLFAHATTILFSDNSMSITEADEEGPSIAEDATGASGLLRSQVSTTFDSILNYKEYFYK